MLTAARDVGLIGGFVSGRAIVGLTPNSGRYDVDDERWREQVADLMRDLRVQTEALVVDRTPVRGSKGPFDQLLFAGSAVAIGIIVGLPRSSSATR